MQTLRKSPLHRAPRAQTGFSLIEILLVLGIIVFIATLVAGNLIGRGETAKVSQAKAGVQKVASAVNNYYLDTGQIPKSIEALMTKPGDAPNWKGPYLQASQIKDPWDTPYQFKVPGEGGQEFEVISLGADRAAGGTERAKDIKHWE
ncbi:MAG: type II secretion system major pseudopilin GspG [Xanthomonadales bacterium]|jgi:general secretion pathway protein G|nr:type II secretion system major pseudopilin GspG [Xanthomonadales bacterium]